MTNTGPKVDTPHKAYTSALPRWTRCRDAYEGSDAVKERGDVYLPKLSSHKTTEGAPRYKEYKLRALFYNATGRTVEGLSGAVFQRAPQVELPSGIKEEALQDVTLSGESLELFALEQLKEVLILGRVGVLVDMPPEDEVDTTDDDALRPYVVSYTAENIINWRTAVRGGDEVLTMVVLHETEEVPKDDDMFCTEEVEVYRVLLLDGEGDTAVYRQEVWWKPKGDQQYSIRETVQPVRRGTDSLTFIPFLFINPFTNSVKVEKPPLDDMVQVNFAHYRNSADFEHGLHWTALPTPVVSGKMDEKSGTLNIGSETAWVLGEGGSASMLEFSGAGLGAIAEAMTVKQKMMATLGARLLEDVGGAAETATAIMMRHGGEHATLRTITQSVENGIMTALQYMAWWVGTEDRPKLIKCKFELNKDFFSGKMSTDELRTWMLLLQGSGVSYATFYAALEKGQVTRPGVDAEEEKAEIDAETAAAIPDALKDYALPGGPDDPNNPGGDDPAKQDPSKSPAPPAPPQVPPGKPPNTPPKR